MKDRRTFLKLTSLSAAGMITQAACNTKMDKTSTVKEASVADFPAVISTWDHGVPANKKAMEILSNGGSALDAVEAGVRVVESDPKVTTVGIGGFPDREGNITLDACIMDEKSRCGAVAFLQNIENPISVARRVMENTPHVMLAGKGAYQFAKSEGFEHKDLHTEKSRKAYQNWLVESRYKPVVNIENHDTISMLAIDKNGNMSGSCTTSGMSFKMHGRVGDSPLIGSGLFLDNDIGGACATGVGEAIIRVAGSAMVVEAMRYGKSPQEACEEVVNRIVDKHPNIKGLQAGFIAMNKKGEVGAYAVYKGFTYAHQTTTKAVLLDSKSKLNIEE